MAFHTRRHSTPRIDSRKHFQSLLYGFYHGPRKHGHQGRLPCMPDVSRRRHLVRQGFLHQPVSSPFYSKATTSRETISASIIFQVTNDAYYTDLPTAELVRYMGPRDLGVISPSVDIPSSDSFFALAAEAPTLQRIDRVSFEVNTAADNYSA